MRIRAAYLSIGLLVITGSGLLVGQQQAAEAPASSTARLTRPAVTGLHGLVAAGHPIAASAGLQMLLKGGVHLMRRRQ